MRPRRPRLPVARLVSNEPTAAQVRWTLRLTFLVLAMWILVALGNHLPKG